MPVGDAAANGQTNPRALIFVAAVQALKNGEDFVHVLFFESDAVVLNGDFTNLFARVRAEKAGKF